MQNGSPPLQTPEGDRAVQPSLWERFCSHFHMRPPQDDDPQSWWIASTAIPLVAAAAGPLANVMSIVALVMPWRSEIIARKDGPGGNWIQKGYDDPHWSIAMNAVSVFCGIVGNIFLLLNFTQSVRYIIALPFTIVLWFLATGILTGLTAALSIFDPPIPPNHVYSQAYWSAVIAAILYFSLTLLLVINMLGYFLGKYPQHFTLTDDQRTLILQMTAFVIWLLIGAAIFQRVIGISFADALYFCDITVLTLGFGDVTPKTSVGRGLVWPYAVIGIIQLGLVVGSIHQFAQEVHYDNVVRKHIEQKRQDTFERSITPHELDGDHGMSADIKDIARPGLARRSSRISFHPQHKHQTMFSTITALTTNRRPKLLVMREEKDRFDAMRAIQYETMRFRRWNDLIISLIVFGIVWTCGAVVFWQLEAMTYFESLYFCFCSLITIGYGDFTPKSNAGRPFFVMWSLIAIPTMTMLISQMSDTVVAGFKHATEKFAGYFVMPESGAYKKFLSHLPFVLKIIQKRQEKQRIKRGFQVGAQADDDVDVDAEEGQSSTEKPKSKKPKSRTRPPQDRPQRTIEELARESNPSQSDLAQQLAFAIRRTTQDVKGGKRTRYSYEEWVEFTRLIQFTNPRSRPSSSAGGSQGPSADDTIVINEDEFGVLNWDWIGENSPMLAHQTEPEWVLDRLCESLVRYVSKQELARAKEAGRELDQEEEATLRKEQDLGIEEA